MIVALFLNNCCKLENTELKQDHFPDERNHFSELSIDNAHSQQAKDLYIIYVCVSEIGMEWYKKVDNKQIMPEVIILGCIYALPAYRDLMRAKGPKHIPIY